MHPATASPTSVRTLVSDELASNAVSAAPSVVPTTASHPTPVSRCRSILSARTAPITG